MKLRKDRWEPKRLVELCELITCGVAAKPKYVDDGIPFLSSQNVKNGRIIWSDYKCISETTHKELTKNNKPLKGDILYTRVGSYGEAAVIEDANEFSVFVSLTLIKVKKHLLDNYFLKYFLNSDTIKKLAKKSVRGSGVGNLNVGSVREFPIQLPPLAEQKQIAALFQSIETTMEQVDGQEQHLKALKKSLVNGLLNKEPVFGNLLNRKNCRATTFGEIAECDKKYTEHEKEVERFVGLEWIEADNFQLQGFGLVADGTTFSKRFAIGDVLFGKRRAYLKKVAVADFDGICSGDILVIRGKDKKILQGLLPYYISADAFIQHAVSTSAGSLSPRTKWKDLANLEVSIPDLKTQSVILEVLQQLDTTVNQLKQQKTTLKNLKQKLLSEILG